MKTSMTAMIMIALLLAGCGTSEDTGQQAAGSTLENVKAEYSHVEKSLNEIPEKKVQLMKLPSYLPFEEKNVSVDMIDLPPKEGSPDQVDVIFQGKNEIVRVTHFFIKRSASKNDKKVTLENGTEATFIHNVSNAFSLRWDDENKNVTYGVTLRFKKGTEQYDKEALIKIANSMIEK